MAAAFDVSLGDAVGEEDESFAGVELAFDWSEFRCCSPVPRAG